MLINDTKYSYPTLERVTHDNGTRFYVCPDSGRKLPSVTTILSSTSDKDFSEWENRIGKKQADIERKYGSDLGTLVHTHLECHILKEERPSGNNLIRTLSEKMANVVIDNCLSGIDEIWGLETTLFMPSLYAGTTDVVGIYRGKQAIMDFKTAKNLRKKEDIADYRDQLCAYALAHDTKHDSNIEIGVIFMVDRNMKHAIYEYDYNEMALGKDSFLSRVETFYSSN